MDIKGIKRIIFIDNHDEIRESLSRYLEDHGFKVKAYSSAEAALQKLKEVNPLVAVCDFNLGIGRMDGIRFFQHMAKSYPDIPVILTSMTGGVDALAEMVGCRFVFKEDVDSLLGMIGEIVG